MPKIQPFFNIPAILSLSLTSRISIINILVKLFRKYVYVDTKSSYIDLMSLIQALSHAGPGLDLRTTSWLNDPNADNPRFDSYLDPNDIELPDYLQYNRFLMTLNKIKKCRNLDDLRAIFDIEEINFVFLRSEAQLQLLQSIILSDNERRDQCRIFEDD